MTMCFLYRDLYIYLVEKVALDQENKEKTHIWNIGVDGDLGEVNFQIWT